MVDLDLVIVNWNTGLQLRDCLQSILVTVASSDLNLSKCIVVDNASQDGSTEGLDGLPLPLMLIKNHENRGFSCACNQGAKAGKSEYILFLNPDIRLIPNSLVKALQFMDDKGNEQIGILGIQLVDQNGIIQRSVARFPTPQSLFTQMLGLDRLWPRRFPSHFMSDWDHRVSKEVDQVEGAFYLVRREEFEALNGFDERFFMYFEDLDFAYRAKQAGWTSYYLADTQAFHQGGGATNQIKAKRLFYVLNSRVLYVAKHFGRTSAINILIATFLFEFWVRVGGGIINFSRQSVLGTIQTYWMFLRALPQLIEYLR
jgi:N-acetylglucosaminyl-diphospho-decaprenol L-rhamnosyltransferase